mmetsp:Transcript_9558/g.19457  ORF Transcript_9558/g.19457 Transcript_9558/m.19457 type:complete len:210 (+) Transcript_9558:1760-2389(+)
MKTKELAFKGPESTLSFARNNYGCNALDSCDPETRRRDDGVQNLSEKFSVLYLNLTRTRGAGGYIVSGSHWRWLHAACDLARARTPSLSSNLFKGFFSFARPRASYPIGLYLHELLRLAQCGRGASLNSHPPSEEEYQFPQRVVCHVGNGPHKVSFLILSELCSKGMRICSPCKHRIGWSYCMSPPRACGGSTNSHYKVAARIETFQRR